jgi:tetratricopeptide (TPR) repeat protein
VVSHQRNDQVAPLHEGDLAEVPFAKLLYTLARARRTGAVEIRRGPLHKEVFLEDGVPVDCRSNLVHETLSRFMVSTGRLETGIADDAFRESVARSLRFGDVLIERELTTAEELIRIMQQNLAHKLLDGFSWRDGRFRLTADMPATDSPLKVNVPQLILIGVGRFATQEQIDGSIAPLIGTELAVHPSPPLPVADGKLPASYRTLLETMRQGSMRIDQLAAGCALSYPELTRHLYALTLIEMVVPARELPPAAPVAERPEPPAAGARAKPVQARRPAVEEGVTNELLELALNHRRKDPFELLGVDPEQVLTTAHTCYLRFAEKFAPWRFEGELEGHARDVFLAAARAYAQLCDPDRRAKLLASRAEAREVAEPAPARDAFRVKSTLLDPAQQFRKGQELVAANRHRQAITQFEFAVDLDPQNLDYRAELAWCRYHADPNRSEQRALSELADVLRVDPHHGPALFFSGEILRVRGHFEEAEVFLRRAIKPMAPDRRPIDALKSLSRDREALD